MLPTACDRLETMVVPAQCAMVTGHQSNKLRDPCADPARSPAGAWLLNGTSGRLNCPSRITLMLNGVGPAVVSPPRSGTLSRGTVYSCDAANSDGMGWARQLTVRSSRPAVHNWNTRRALRCVGKGARTPRASGFSRGERMVVDGRSIRWQGLPRCAGVPAPMARAHCAGKRVYRGGLVVAGGGQLWGSLLRGRGPPTRRPGKPRGKLEILRSLAVAPSRKWNGRWASRHHPRPKAPNRVPAWRGLCDTGLGWVGARCATRVGCLHGWGASWQNSATASRVRQCPLTVFIWIVQWEGAEMCCHRR